MREVSPFEKTNNIETKKFHEPPQTKEEIQEFTESLVDLESRRLQNPRESFYDGLRSFARRAAAIGALVTTLLGGMYGAQEVGKRVGEKVAQRIYGTSLYKPYFEKLLAEKPNGNRIMLEHFHNKDMVEKGKTLRSLIDAIVSNIAESEKLHVATLNVQLTMVQGYLYGEINPELRTLSLDIRSDLDPTKDKKALEALVAHELGHFNHFSHGNALRNEEAEVLQRVQQEYPNINKEIADLEKEIQQMRENKNPDYSRSVAKTKTIQAQIHRGDSENKIKEMEEEIKSLQHQIDNTNIWLTSDPKYRTLIFSLSELKNKFASAYAREMLRQGGTEMIADFFMAKQALREQWTREDLNDALIKIFGKGKEYYDDIHGLDSDSRREAILIYYDTISRNPDFWLNLPITTKTIQDNIKQLYFGHT